jgi:hypothetical protein
LSRCIAAVLLYRQVQAQEHNAAYLSSKHRRMSHILNPSMYSDTEDEVEPLQGQFCFW